MKNRSKTYDRGYVDAADKLRVFIESRSKVMYVDHNYASAEVARRAYTQAIKNMLTQGRRTRTGTFRRSLSDSSCGRCG